MSRGLGAVQREILQAFHTLCARQERGRMTTYGWCLPRGPLADAVATARGGQCHADAFGRALRGLVRRGLLRAVNRWGQERPLSPGTQVRFLAPALGDTEPANQTLNPPRQQNATSCL